MDAQHCFGDAAHHSSPASASWPTFSATFNFLQPATSGSILVDDQRQSRRILPPFRVDPHSYRAVGLTPALIFTQRASRYIYLGAFVRLDASRGGLGGGVHTSDGPPNLHGVSDALIHDEWDTDQLVQTSEKERPILNLRDHLQRLHPAAPWVPMYSGNGLEIQILLILAHDKNRTCPYIPVCCGYILQVSRCVASGLYS